jgi:hypothetical protein
MLSHGLTTDKPTSLTFSNESNGDGLKLMGIPTLLFVISEEGVI